MNVHLQKALEDLKNGAIASSFYELNQVEMPKHLQSLCNELRSEFISNKVTSLFYYKMEIFIEELGRYIEQIEKPVFEHIIEDNLRTLHKKLDLNNTNFNGFSEDFRLLEKSTHLEILDLHNNNIKEFPAYILSKLKNLKELYLGENPIVNIPREIFDRNENVLVDVKNYFKSLLSKNIEDFETDYVLYVEFKNFNISLEKIKNLIISFRTKYLIYDGMYIFKFVGNGFLVSGNYLLDITQKAIDIQYEIQDYPYEKEGFENNIEVGIGLHTNKKYESNTLPNNLFDTPFAQLVILSSYTTPNEIFCSEIYAKLLAQDTTHNFSTISLGNYNLNRMYEEVVFGVFVLFENQNEKIYKEQKVENCKKYLSERLGKTASLKFEEITNSLKIFLEANSNNHTFRYDLALAYLNLGQKQLEPQNNDIIEAFSLFDDAKGLLNELCKEFPEDLSYKNTLAITYQWLGEVYLIAGNTSQALLHFEKFNQIMQDLYTKYPNTEEFEYNFAVSYLKLWEIQNRLGEFTNSLIFLNKVCFLLQNLINDVSNNEKYFHTLSIVFGNVGNTHLQLGDFQEALKYFRKNYHQAKDLYNKNIEILAYGIGFYTACQNMVRVYMTLENFEKSLYFSKKQNKIAYKLYKKNKKNPDIKNALAISCQSVGQVYFKNDNFPGALDAFEHFYELEKQLCEDYPTNSIYKNQLANACFDIGKTYHFLEGAENLDYTLDFSEESLHLRKELCNETPDNVSFKHDLAVLCGELGEMYKFFDIEKAKENYALAKNLWKELSKRFPDDRNFGQYQIFIEKAEILLTTKPLNQAKMLLIGNGNVGKSSILFRLKDKISPLPPRDSTSLIAIDSYIVKDIPIEITQLDEPIDFELKVWDFGGQGKYREIQNLFCTPKSLYVYVTSPDDVEDKDDYIGYEYWFAMAQTLGKTPQESQTEEHQSPIIHIK